MEGWDGWLTFGSLTCSLLALTSTLPGSTSTVTLTTAPGVPVMFTALVVPLQLIVTGMLPDGPTGTF